MIENTPPRERVVLVAAPRKGSLDSQKVAEHLEEARNELVATEAIYGEHHMTVMCVGRTMAEVTSGVTAIGAALTDRSILWVREDLNCEPCFWAQLPGNFAYIARKSIISSKNFAGIRNGKRFPSW